MKDRVFGIETEYAVIYHPGRIDRERPTSLELYRRYEALLRGRVCSLPMAFSPFRAKGGRFLENGCSFHYEANALHYEHGLIEMASPECRDPFVLLRYERAKDRLMEELTVQVNAELKLAGYTGDIRIGKNNVDSEGHTFGSHESYWVDDPLTIQQRLLVLPAWIVLWALSLPVLALVIGLQLVILLGLSALATAALATGLMLSFFRQAAANRVYRWVERFGRRLELHPGHFARRLHRLSLPLYGLMWAHSKVYNFFHFVRIREGLTSFLITRTIFSGAGAVALDQGELLRFAQRPPFLRTLSRIFPDGDDRPLYETRDLFFRPWSALVQKRRLHLLIGDANLCDWAQVLRVGTTALVLEAIEAGDGDPWPELADPLEALRTLNRGTDPHRRLRLKDGGECGALELQQQYRDRVCRMLDREQAEPWKRKVLQMWEETLDELATSSVALSDRLDWRAKEVWIEREFRGSDDRRVLREAGASALVDPDPWVRDLAYRLLRADLRYHELSPRGGFRRSVRQGRIRSLCADEDVEYALTRPPNDTRAWARGEAIRLAHQQARSGGAAWHRVRVGKWGWRWFRDPLDSGRPLTRDSH